MKPIYGFWIFFGTVIFIWFGMVWGLPDALLLIVLTASALAVFYVGFRTTQSSRPHRILIIAGGISLILLPLAGALQSETLATMSLIAIWIITPVLALVITRKPLFTGFVFLVTSDALWVLRYEDALPAWWTVAILISGFLVGLEYFKSRKEQSLININRECQGDIETALHIFEDVWYLPEENKWREMNLLAFRDIGKLIVKEDSLEFHGEKEKAVITKIKRLTLGKQGRDFVNNWIKVEYGDGQILQTAFFADGSWLGWGGIFGGTQRILNALPHGETIQVTVKKILPLPLIISGITLVLVLAAIGGFFGYSVSYNSRHAATAESVNQQLNERFEQALADIQAGRYESAKARLELILQIDPHYPGAAEKLAEVLLLINMNPATPKLLPTETSIPPTPSPKIGDKISIGNGITVAVINHTTLPEAMFSGTSTAPVIPTLPPGIGEIRTSGEGWMFGRTFHAVTIDMELDGSTYITMLELYNITLFIVGVGGGGQEEGPVGIAIGPKSVSELSDLVFYQIPFDPVEIGLGFSETDSITDVDSFDVRDVRLDRLKKYYGGNPIRLTFLFDIPERMEVKWMIFNDLAKISLSQ